MDKLDVMMEEYKALRDEVVKTPSQRIQIFSLGMASAAVVVAGAVNAIAVGHARLLPGLVLLLMVPLICWAALHSWMSEATRGRRASFYLRGIERRVNDILTARALGWEEDLRKSRDTQMMYMFRGHYWYVWGVFSLTALASGAIGGLYTAWDLSEHLCRTRSCFCNTVAWRVIGAVVPSLLLGIGTGVLYVPRILEFKLWDQESDSWPAAIP